MSSDDGQMKPLCLENPGTDSKDSFDDASGSDGSSGTEVGAVEADEEESLTDPQQEHRDACKDTEKCKEYFEKLTTCNDRVNSRSKTAETCLEELIDYVHCVDHCAAKKFFPKLK